MDHPKRKEAINKVSNIRYLIGWFLLVCVPGVAWAPLSAPNAGPAAGLEGALIVTQLPVDPDLENGPTGGMLRADYGERGRIVRVWPGSEPEVLTPDFHSAGDPDISFDGKQMLFAARRKASDPWNIFEMRLDGSGVRQLTRGIGDCRHPVYQGTIYKIVADQPWRHITFVSSGAGELNEHGTVPSTSLYSCNMDGTGARRLTFNPSSDFDPVLLPDGRLLFSSWQRSTLDRGARGRNALFASQTDGLDYALFSGDEGRRIKHMPCVTTDRLVVFVESDEVPWDGAGTLASVDLRRNLHSYRRITDENDGLFVSPSPLPDGGILVSRRTGEKGSTHGVYRLDPSSGRSEVLFDDPRFHDVQAKIEAARPEPDGRASVASEDHPNGKLYCLSIHESDLGRDAWIPPGGATRLRVLEGIPRKRASGAAGPGRVPPLLPRRMLGEIEVEQDGSFNIEVPANIPIELQLLDADGVALRSCGWIWVGNRETRGCIGCHEDPERTPQNRFVQALARPSTNLVLPPERRRTVVFRRDVLPIVSGKCAVSSCHGGSKVPPFLGRDPGGNGALDSGRAYESLMAASGDGGMSSPGSYVHPGRARTSPLIWHALGRNTSRPWDGGRSVLEPAPMPPEGAAALTADERRTLVEWIDLGARWDDVSVSDGGAAAPEGGAK